MTSHWLKRFSFILEEACCSTPITADSGDIAALVLLDPQRSVRYRSCEIRTHLVLKNSAAVIWIISIWQIPVCKCKLGVVFTHIKYSGIWQDSLLGPIIFTLNSIAHIHLLHIYITMPRFIYPWSQITQIQFLILWGKDPTTLISQNDAEKRVHTFIALSWST